jgi:hypothetical protein
MGTELTYQEESAEDSRVSGLLNQLACSLDDEETESLEPWQPQSETDWVEASEKENHLEAPRTWQILDSSANSSAAWSNHNDGIQVKWANLASQGVLEDAPRETRELELSFQADPKLVPGVGQDGFRSTEEEEADWQAALSGEGAFAMASAENMGAALDDLVSCRLGSPLRECIELIELGLQRSSSDPVELPPGAAVVDVVWELHRELEWNDAFKLALTEHLGLHGSLSKQQFLEVLVSRISARAQQNKRLLRLQQKFQSLVRRALDTGLELEVFELEEDDPFARLLLSLGVRTARSCHQDIVCQSLDAIGC